MIAQRVPDAIAVRDTTRPARRYELDWLRAVVILGLIPYHAAGIFAAGADVYIKDPHVSLPLNAAGTFFDDWAIPLLFVIAGASARFSLSHHTGPEYLGGRVKRLLLPFLFATLAVVPVQVYFALLSDPGLAQRHLVPISDPHFLDSYPRFYLQYLQDYWYYLRHYSPQLEFIFWGHLWFIARLIVYSFIALPVLLFCGTSLGTRLIGLLARWTAWRGTILLFGLPLGLSVLGLRSAQHLAPLADLTFKPDWAQLGVLLIFYIYGYILFVDGRFERALLRSGALILALGVAVFFLMLGISGGVAHSLFLLETERLGQGFVSWFWVAAILSLGMRYLARTNRVLRYLTDAAFPIYVLHMPALMLIASLVLGLDLPVAAKYALLVAGTAALTLTIYDLVVKRFRVTRLLFGMKPKERRALAEAVAPEKAKVAGR